MFSLMNFNQTIGNDKTKKLLVLHIDIFYVQNHHHKNLYHIIPKKITGDDFEII